MKHRRLALPPAQVHRWARRARAVNPKIGPIPENPEAAQLRQDLPTVVERMNAYGVRITAVPTPSRQNLTRLQRELRDATEVSPQVAQDLFLQQFRKHMHLLLEH